ncbi:MAG: nicotinate-nucleotide adenylyltransferase [Thermomicrobiales bacterium]|nr:nicotinate-nucleotide adenylyltransferase [Thermomicrobiales bacterium]
MDPLRIGILGGTFDPIHIGHLVMASYAIDALNLDSVWFMPAQSPPHKHGEITPAEHRAEMVRRAVALDSRFQFSNLDLQPTGPSYTVDLLKRILEVVPHAHPVFLMGADSLRGLPTWRDPEGIIALAEIGVAERPGTTIDESVRHGVTGLAARLSEFDSPLIELSSTEIRERRKKSLSITYLVPEDVEDYIVENGLYR